MVKSVTIACTVILVYCLYLVEFSIAEQKILRKISYFDLYFDLEY